MSCSTSWVFIQQCHGVLEEREGSLNLHNMGREVIVINRVCVIKIDTDTLNEEETTPIR